MYFPETQNNSSYVWTPLQVGDKLKVEWRFAGRIILQNASLEVIHSDDGNLVLLDVSSDYGLTYFYDIDRGVIFRNGTRKIEMASILTDTNEIVEVHDGKLCAQIQESNECVKYRKIEKGDRVAMRRYGYNIIEDGLVLFASTSFLVVELHNVPYTFTRNDVLNKTYHYSQRHTGAKIESNVFVGNPMKTSIIE